MIPYFCSENMLVKTKKQTFSNLAKICKHIMPNYYNQKQMAAALCLHIRTFQRIIKARGIVLKGSTFTQEQFDFIKKEVEIYFEECVKKKLPPPITNLRYLF